MNGKTKDEYAEANIPPHVKAIDARRAAEMRKPGNEKLAEWSQEISLALAEMETIWWYQHAKPRLESLQAEIVEAMGK